LGDYVFPIFGAGRVDQIHTSHVLRALSPIWLTRPETARRVRQRIGTVLDWAKAAGHRTGENPIDGVTEGLPQQPKKDEHHAALPYAEVPGFVSDLRKASRSEPIKLAFEFLILTAARTNEVLLWPSRPSSTSKLRSGPFLQNA
jgi:integrase